MTEETVTTESTLNVVKEEVNSESTISESTVAASQSEVEPAPIPFATPAERVDALHEISVLQQLINTHYFHPHFDAGNKGKSEPKITKSTQLNYFSNQIMKTWAHRINFLTERLLAK